MTQKTYVVQGMDCADCARTIEKGVSQLSGVQSVEVDFATTKLRLSGEVAEATLRQRVEALGYRLGEKLQPPTSTLHPNVVAAFWRYLLERNETRLAVMGSGALLVAALGLWLSAPRVIVNGLWIAAMLVAGYPIARSGLNALFINRDFNINLLMTIAAVGAVLIGELWEAATVILLFAIAEALAVCRRNRRLGVVA